MKYKIGEILRFKLSVIPSEFAGLKVQIIGYDAEDWCPYEVIILETNERRFASESCLERTSYLSLFLEAICTK